MEEQAIDKTTSALVIIVLTMISSMPISVALTSAPLIENSWTLKTGMPTARDGLGVTVLNGKIYAIGGYSTMAPLNANEAYDPTTDTWAWNAPMPTPRSDLAVAVYKGKIFCMGGRAHPYTTVNEVYDPASNSWEKRNDLPKPMDFRTAYVINNKIYATCRHYNLPTYWPDSSKVMMEYDPETDSWKTRTSAPHIITCALAAIDDKILYIGARHNSSGPDDPLVMVYDPKIDSWNIRGMAPTYGEGEDAAVTTGVSGPKRIYVFEREATYIYDPYTDNWTKGAPRPADQYNVKAIAVDDVFYVLGGSTTEETFPTYKGTVYSTNQVYTPFLFGTVPSLSILSPKNTSYATNGIPFNLTVNQATSWLGYSLDGRDNVTVTGETNFTDLSEGTHTLVVYAKNYAGDVTSSAIVDFAIDYTSPCIRVLSPENRTYQASNVPLTFAVNELAAGMGYSLDGREIVAVPGNTTLSGLSVGLHSVTVYANDTVGNTGESETVSFIVETSQEPILVAAVSVAVAAVVAVGVQVYLKKRKREAEPM